MEKIAAAGSSYETGRASDRMLDSSEFLVPAVVVIIFVAATTGGHPLSSTESFSHLANSCMEL
jgi:hypothetical protein